MSRDRQVRDDRLHQRGRRAVARAGLEFVELPHRVARRPADDRRDPRQPLQVGAMADRAAVRLAGDAGGERLAARDAPRRHVGDEARVRVAVLELLQVLGHFDHALADRLARAGLRIGQEPAGDHRHRHVCALDHADVLPRRRAAK